MYHLIQKRDNLGSVIAEEQEGEEDLQLFLERFDLEKHPETGLISNLQDDEVALPITPPAYSPVTGYSSVQQSQRDVSDSPLDRSASVATGSAQGDKIAHEDEDYKSMDVDDIAASVHHEGSVSAGPSNGQTTRGVSRERSSTHEVKTEDVEQASAVAEGAGIERQSSTPKGDQSIPASRAASTVESLMQESIDHPSAANYIDPPATQQSSPPQPERSGSGSEESRQQESPVKSEPLDDEPMDVLEDLSATQPSKGSESPKAHGLSLQHSEDHIMDIIGPPLAASSPPRGDEEQHHPSDYHIPLPFTDPIEDYTIEGDITEGLPDKDVTPEEPFGPEPPYPLPPLSLLPVEFSRRGKTSKRERKRDKERDKGEPKKEEWAPMSLAKWSAVLRANPVHKKLQRATKCLSTRDWSVGMQELRLIRTFERIEALKDAGRWSFRQIKKQRGVGGLTKTHWDYLLDEMKWMRTDFREERRWKLALAFTLVHAVMEWHEAGSLEERVKRGICVMWKPPRPENEQMAEVSEPEQADVPLPESQEEDDTGVDSRETGTPANDYGSDDESDEEQDKEQQDVIDVLHPAIALQDALEQLEEQNQSSQTQDASQEGVTLQPKLEEIENLTALTDSSQSRDENAMDVDTTKVAQPEGSKPERAEAAKAAVPKPESHPALKATSKNPVLGKPTSDGDAGHGKPKSKVGQYAPLREHIVYSEVDKLFLDLDDLEIIKGMSDLTTDDFSPTAPPPPADLASIFPDLQPYGMLDVAPPGLIGQDGKKKSDRRGDRDDPNKRAEDTTYSKLAPMSKFMQIKPTLLGTLKPAKHWKDGHWERIEETPVFADIDVPPARPIEENLCALFEGGKSGSGHPSIIPMAPKDARKRASEMAWTPAEDALLKQMVEKYPHNWNLIAEAFNSARVTISTDKRTAWDCLERWRERMNLEGRGAAEEASQPATPAGSSSVHITRGVKRTANQSGAANGSGVNGAGPSEPKKLKRHTIMHDTLRKAAKRREAVQKSNTGPRSAKPSVVHETHAPVTKMLRLTPAELSRMKAEKEARDAQELLMRRRNEELARQHLLREQAQRAQGGLPPNAQQQPQAPQAPPTAGVNGVARPPGATPQMPMVQQIRSQVGISQQQQQQRLAAAIAAGANTRMSPPQYTPAQAAHFRAMAAAQGQGQALGQVPGQPPGQAGGQVPAQMPQPSSASAALSAAAPALSAVHLSPSFAARATSSSPGLPQQSPPLPAASPANATVARPPSVPGQPVQGVPMNPMMHAQNVAQYYLQMQQRGLTPEQLQAMVAQQRQAAQQAQQQPQQGQQQYGGHTQQQQQQQQQAAQQGQPNAQNGGGGYQHT
ncbi:hypothetical protein BN946_scf185002.g84 [Trametes cinnabarina]|uniref:Vacuolar import and degradation protein 21 n=1 Tax=Pycnoporus cinnabarinus TaxID=5643 RepID=A0A060SL13_PYCCI|nr:hypothetical protein BN946_scf185002.g84 [Trametes cinnabarina]